MTIYRERRRVAAGATTGKRGAVGGRVVLDVAVGPFRIADAGRAAVVDEIAGYGERGEQCVALALHVGGLVQRDDEAFVRAFNAADVRYADGNSVVLLARIGGATRIERAPTTDVGHVLLRALRSRLGRTLRVALVGGPPGLADRAGEVLAQAHDVDVVGTHDGYGFRSDEVVRKLAAARPDVVLVGLGMPLEALWIDEHRSRLSATVIMTCGGWFGFLAGRERRAPPIVRTLYLEWLWRVAQQPRRLAGRYLRGALATGAMAAGTILRRMSGTRATGRRG